MSFKCQINYLQTLDSNPVVSLIESRNRERVREKKHKNRREKEAIERDT